MQYLLVSHNEEDKKWLEPIYDKEVRLLGLPTLVNHESGILA